MKVFIFSELPLKFVNSLLMFENYFDRLGLLFNIIKKLKLFTGIEAPGRSDLNRAYGGRRNVMFASPHCYIM